MSQITPRLKSPRVTVHHPSDVVTIVKTGWCSLDRLASLYCILYCICILANTKRGQCIGLGAAQGTSRGHQCSFLSSTSFAPAEMASSVQTNQFLETKKYLTLYVKHSFLA